MRISTKLADITLDAWDGTPVQLGSTWRDAPVVLVFLRHFG
ncbi:MAG: hypothetical protein AAF430_08675 [Myxococcota bacterium]